MPGGVARYERCNMKVYLREQAALGLERRASEAAATGMEHAGIIARRGAIAGCRFHVLEGVERLMPQAARTILDLDSKDKDLESGTVWWASSLKAPRGRMQRQWWAPEGGIYFCIALFPEIEQRRWPLYSIAMGVAVADAMRYRGIPAHIRWINDILINGRKVSGTLAETIHAPGSDQTYLLIGTGINVNISSFPPHLTEASSLFIETGKRWQETELGADVISAFGWYTGMLHQWDADNLGREREDEEKCPVISQWKRFSNSLGRQIRFGRDLEKEPGHTGMSLDITNDGRLVIRNVNGEIIRLDSGEIRYS